MVEARKQMINSRTTEMGFSWHVVEAAINCEIEWLRKTIPHNYFGEKIPGCDDCLYTFRKIALLIITGKIRAREFMAREGHDLWDDLTQRQGVNKLVRHGGEWHRKMIDVITTYFTNQGFEVIPEPYVSKGRADLGVYKKGYEDLFIEVGTTSVYKLWWNLQMPTNCQILLVPEENHAIQFTCQAEGHDTLRKLKDEN